MANWDEIAGKDSASGTDKGYRWIRAEVGKFGKIEKVSPDIWNQIELSAKQILHSRLAALDDFPLRGHPL